MRIERINDNQIKCTLNRSDLATHHVKASELAYGADKARALFQDMMDQAFVEFGFEASDSLMIEAIPVSMDCIVLMITNVDEPDDVDEKFHSLSDLNDLPPEDEAEEEHSLPGFDEFFGGPRADDIEEGGARAIDSDGASRGASRIRRSEPARKKAEKCVRVYSFSGIDRVIAFAHKAAPAFKGESSLYKSPEDGKYTVVLESSSRSSSSLGKVCSLALEYGSKEPSGFARVAFYDEHFTTLIRQKALQKLADI